MKKLLKRAPDLCVIGAGSAGLSVASLAAGLGAKVLLIEQHKMGGECLNSGCVPSKALLAAAKAAHNARQASGFGVDATPRVNFARVREHVQATIKTIAPHDSVQRFEKLGVEVLRDSAHFAAPGVIHAGRHEIKARYTVIATGSEPAVPQIPGLTRAKYFTNETIFDNKTLPKHLVVLGGGPLGMEIAQAHRRLGSAVTVLERGKAMPKDDAALARMLLQSLVAEGVVVHEHAEVQQIEPDAGGVRITFKRAGKIQRLRASHVLIAAGRKARIEGLDLDSAGIAYSDKGITVDHGLRTSARGVFALGDVIEGPHFTHVCTYQAGVIVRNTVFRLNARVDYSALPWVTYTDPELAQIGMTEAQAKKEHGDDVRVLKVDYAGNDRALAERKTEGALKLIAKANGDVLGASILGAQAGELAALWGLTIARGIKLKHIGQMIAPYPTLSELSKAAAAEFYKPKLFGEATHRLVRFLSWLP